MSITTRDERRTTFPASQTAPLSDCDSLLDAYAISGVVDAAARSLETSAYAVEVGLRSGRSLRELAHELRRDPGDLQLAIARGAESARVDDRSAGELIAAAGRLLDARLLLAPP